MQQFFILFLITTMFSFSILLASGEPWFFVASFVAVGGGLFLQGLKCIPAQPPHVAVLTVFGRRIEVVKKEGWRFFPLYPWWHGAILVNVTKVNQDLPEQKVRTPELAELSVPVSITWIPAKDSGAQLIEFLDSGGRKGVETILEDVVRERLREWAISNEEGPENWKDAMGAREEAVAILLKAILGGESFEKTPDSESPEKVPGVEYLKRIPSGIPTPILLRYFAEPQKFPSNDRDKKRWGEEWEILKGELPKDLEKHGLTEKKLKDRVDERREQVQKVRQGQGKFNRIGLGIYINRLNVGEIKPLGKLAEVAELEAKELQERRGEVFEVDTDLMKAEQLVKAVIAKEEELSIQDAYRIVMEWKTTREGRGFTIPGLSPVLAEVVKAFLGKVKGMKRKEVYHEKRKRF